MLVALLDGFAAMLAPGLNTGGFFISL